MLRKNLDYRVKNGPIQNIEVCPVCQANMSDAQPHITRFDLHSISVMFVCPNDHAYTVCYSNVAWLESAFNDSGDSLVR